MTEFGFRREGGNKGYSLEVFVNNAIKGDLASKLAGYFILDEKRFVFKAIAFGKIGGHNVGIDVTDKTLRELKKMNYDPDDILLDIQRKLIEGDITLIDKKGLK